MPIFSDDTDRFAEQDVLARLDYSEDWSSFMALAEGDTIITSNWLANAPGLLFTDKLIDGDVTSVWVAGGTPGTVYRIANQIETAQGRGDVRYFFLSVIDGAAEMPVLQTALFNRFRSINQFKTASLAFTSGSFPIEGIRDDDIWSSLVQAEAEAAHHLRVLLQPTVVLPEDAPQFERDALTAAGTPFVTEAAYDYDPATWSRDAWGFLKLKQTPVVRLDSVKLSYPRPEDTVLEIPADWCRLDHKYGHLQFVPTGSMMNIGPLYAYMMSAIGGGRVIPQMIQIRYVAGLSVNDYPDLVGLVQRMAVLKILKGGFLPQSGSISGDGLSQSSSIDTGKWQEEIDAELGRLRDAIHGIRLGVL